MSESDQQCEYVVFFATVKNEDDGVFVDYVFLGGIVEDKQKALLLSKHIVNDRNIPGAIITRIIPIRSDDFDAALKLAIKYFNNMAKDIYNIEEKGQKNSSS